MTFTDANAFTFVVHIGVQCKFKSARFSGRGTSANLFLIGQLTLEVLNRCSQELMLFMLS